MSTEFVPKLKCLKCERPVRPTLHFADRAEVDYYIISCALGEPLVVACVGCYEGPEKEIPSVVMPGSGVLI